MSKISLVRRVGWGGGLGLQRPHSPQLLGDGTSCRRTRPHGLKRHLVDDYLNECPPPPKQNWLATPLMVNELSINILQTNWISGGRKEEHVQYLMKSFKE